MKFFITIAGIICMFISCYCESYDTIVYLNTKQTIRKLGYPSESHIVQTADGYLLEIHRIPRNESMSTSSKKKKPPVFFQHGLLGSSEDFVLLGTKYALPFQLADLGFDVWLGNVRGNTYSKSHVDLFPNEKRFWNFTWHESAIYDVPAQIDFILNHTKEEKIIYIGYSMGTTIFFAMTSTLPEYNDKIEIAILMAAVGYVKNNKSPLIHLLALFSSPIMKILEAASAGEFSADSPAVKVLTKYFCENFEENLCINVIYLITGSDPKEFNKKIFPSLLNHYPAGYSVKALNHYAQLSQSGKFRQYDYGKKGNEKQYGSPEPPDYDVSRITTPMYIYEGKNDYLSDLEDIQQLAKHLKTLRKLRVVDYPKFSHLDFLVSSDVNEQLYKTLIEDLTSHLNEDNSVWSSILTT